jgi:ribose transport system permease protein
MVRAAFSRGKFAEDDTAVLSQRSVGGGRKQESGSSGRDRQMHRVIEVVGLRYGLVVLWVIMLVGFGLAMPNTFLTAANFSVMFGSQSGAIVLALALAVALSVGEFDLSVASTLGLSATLVAVLNGQDHVPIMVAVAAGVIAGVGVGCVNALLVVKVGINAIVVTLGMATLLLGIAIWVSNSESIGGVSSTLQTAMNYSLLGLSSSFYYAIAIAAIVWYVLRRTPLGRHMLFVGSSHEVARLAGVRVDRIRFGAYVASGCLAAVAGVMVVGVDGGFLADSAQNLLLPAFAAAFLGSAVVVPGRLNAWGTVIAILFLITGITGVELLGLSGTSWISEVFYGVALILAVGVSHILRRGKGVESVI